MINSSYSSNYDVLNFKAQIEREQIALKWNWKQYLKFKIKVCLSLKKIRFILLPSKSIYKALSQVIEKRSDFEPTENIVITVKPHPKPSSLPFFDQLTDFSEKLSNIGAHLLLQGSYADSTATPYSDFDVVVIGDIFNKEIIKIVKEIDSLILRIDPLQHHGVIFIDESNLKSYWQRMLPLVVFHTSITFSEQPVILKISKLIYDDNGPKLVVLNFLNSLSQFLSSDSTSRKNIGLWRWKFILSQLMLLPSLVLNVDQQFVSKADSFKICKKMYSPEAWRCIELATEARRNWPDDYDKTVYLKLRKSSRYPPLEDPQTPNHFEKINFIDDNKFLDSVEQFISETQDITHC